jgi:hypothetical protein
VLQLYAAKTLAGSSSDLQEGSAEAALERLIASEEDEWDGLLRQPDVQQARARTPFACMHVALLPACMSLSWKHA